MDDFLIILTKEGSVNFDEAVDQILSLFRQHGKGLEFTSELPNGNHLQFLDLQIVFCANQVCWGYAPRTKKALLPYDSCHSKLVKRGIASLCLESAVRKSCIHKMQSSFDNQLVRLASAGFPGSLVTGVAESLLQKMKKRAPRAAAEVPREEVRPVAVPYVHKLAHNLKKVASRHGVPLVFSAPRKLGGLCSQIGKEKEKDLQNVRGCGTRHGLSYTKCAEGVVYEIPLACGCSYIGQTGRCLNERIREHERNVEQNKQGPNLPKHIRQCPLSSCGPRFTDVRVIAKSSDQTARELMEAFFIDKKGDMCVSDTSIVLYKSEKKFIEHALSRPH